MSNSAFSKGGQTNFNNTSVAITGDSTKTITILQANGNSVSTTFEGGTLYPSAGIPISLGSAWGTSISNGMGYLQNNGYGTYFWNYPEITSLRSTGASLNQVAIANGSSGMQFITLKTINGNSLFGSGDIYPSPWITDTYGINYTGGDVSIGASNGGAVKFNITNTTRNDAMFINSNYYGATISSNYTALTLNGNGLLNEPVLKVRDYSSNIRFRVDANGNIYASPNLGTATTSYSLYFNISTGQITYGVAGSGGMIYPSGSGLAVVNSGTSWGSTIALSGNSGQFLNGNGIFSTPTFSSQWTTDGSGYGISYSNNVGIGIASSNIMGLYVYKSLASGYAGYFTNTDASGFGMSVGVAANDSKPILALSGNTSTLRFDFRSNGYMYAYSLPNSDQSYVLGYNPSTGQITYLTKPSGGGGSGTVTSVGLQMENVLYNSIVTNSPITISGTLQPSLKSQANNTVFCAPDTNSGIPSFRKVLASDTSGNSYSTCNIWRADSSWTNYLTSTNTSPTGYTLKVENTSSGIGLSAHGTTGAAVIAHSTGYYGLNAQSDSRAAARFGIFPSTTNSIDDVIEIYRNTSGTAAAGIGSRIFFSNQTASGSSHVSGDAYFENVLTNATNTSTRTAEFIWQLGTAGYAPAERMRLLSAGSSTIGAVLKLTPCDAAPTPATEGMIYVNTNHNIYCYLNSSWAQLNNV